MKSVTRKDLPDLPLDPVSPKQGNMWHNTTENSIKFYDGTGVKVFVFLDQLNSHVDTSEIHVERNDNGTGDVLWSAQKIISYITDNGDGFLRFEGNWNADTNSPTLTTGVGEEGQIYFVSVDGITSLNGITDWKVGDWAVFLNGDYRKVDNSEKVRSIEMPNSSVKDGEVSFDVFELGANFNVWNADRIQSVSITAASPVERDSLIFDGDRFVYQTNTPETFYASSDTVTDNTTTTAATKVTLNFDVPVARDYDIFYGFSWSINATNRNFTGTVVLDGSILLDRLLMRQTTNTMYNSDTGLGIQNKFAGFVRQSLSAGSHSVIIQWNVSNNGTTGRIWNARLLAKEVID